MFGFSGSHRTGKTTLASAIAEVMAVPFISTRSSHVFAQMGLDPQADYDFSTRLMIQNALLDDMLLLWKAKRTFVSDRTPLDLLAYTMADITRAALDPDETLGFMQYRNRCIQATNENFATIILLPPAIALVADPTKAPINLAYVDHIHVLLMGLMANLQEDLIPSCCVMKREVVDLNDRVTAASRAIIEAHKQAKSIKEVAVIH